MIFVFEAVAAHGLGVGLAWITRETVPQAVISIVVIPCSSFRLIVTVEYVQPPKPMG